MEASPMRERLLGYLCGALDDVEALQVEMALADPRIGADLRRDLDVLRRATLKFPANNTFNTCAEDISRLIPVAKTVKFVMPKA